MTQEERREYNRKYYQANKEKHKEQMRQFRLEHPDYNKEYGKQYYQTKEGRALYLNCNYKREDRNRDFDTSANITVEWILKNIFTSSCAYCGETDWTLLGTDRIDNTKPHTPDNVVCCCGKCNVERNRRYTFEEFKKIKEHK